MARRYVVRGDRPAIPTNHIADRQPGPRWIVIEDGWPVLTPDAETATRFDSYGAADTAMRAWLHQWGDNEHQTHTARTFRIYGAGEAEAWALVPATTEEGR